MQWRISSVVLASALAGAMTGKGLDRPSSLDGGGDRAPTDLAVRATGIDHQAWPDGRNGNVVPGR